MKYIVAISLVVFLFAVYVIGFYLNGRVKKPENCKKIDCGSCILNCDKRGWKNGTSS